MKDYNEYMKGKPEVDAVAVKTPSEKRREANYCLSLGIGVGALGTAGALAAGAVCPLCVFIAPALVGAGVIGRIQARRLETGESADAVDPTGRDNELVVKF